MTQKLLAIAVAVTIAAMPLVGAHAKGTPSKVIPASVTSIEFVGMDAPNTNYERATTYTEAQVKVTYANGSTRYFPLSYHELHSTLSDFNGTTVGDLYDVDGNMLYDPAGNPQRAETPDANSLMDIPGAKSDDPKKRRLFLVTHHEYDWLDTQDPPEDQYGKQPMAMNLATIDQDKKSGEMTTVSVENIDMSAINGLWIPCAGSLSPWNTHLGSEEYEPDARCALESTDPAYSCASGAIELDSMNRYLDPTGTTKPARVYDYGIVPEVVVDREGSTRVEGHRALGRISRELVDVMPDRRTVYQGDDGTYNVMTMFVADRAEDLSEGTLYAAKWMQTSDADGGAADLEWIRLGHSSDRKIEDMVDDGITFSDIFEAKDTTDKTTCETHSGFKLIKAGHNTGLVECLKPKDDMETAAAFLETRRYAAYVGATVEFEKFEGVTHNAADKKLYVAMTRMRSGMEDKPSDPANDIRIPVNGAGAVYEIDLVGGKTEVKVDTDGDVIVTGMPIASSYVGVAMRALVLGETLTEADDVGNTANVDKIASPDNIKYSEKMRTLFIGEDSSLHVNNFLWAYNVDAPRNSPPVRILSIPAGAESTGLQVVEDANGFAYIMSNYQHAGDFTSSTADSLKDELKPMIDRYKAAIGYIGGLPALK